jgi:hypothetical protein
VKREERKYNKRGREKLDTEERKNKRKGKVKDIKRNGGLSKK